MKTTNREYKFEFTTPGGSSKATADSLEALVALVPAGVVSGVRSRADDSPQRDLDSMAKEVLEALRVYLSKVRGRVGHTVISTAGLELVLVKCYLRGMTIAQARDYLKGEHDFKASNSVVGRYWARLKEMGVVPVTEILPTETQTAFQKP